MHGHAIQVGAAPLYRSKALIAVRVKHNSNDGGVPFHKGHRNAENRQAMNEVGGAIQRIYNPPIAGIFGSVRSAFFGQKTRLRQNGF